jgi:endonuclease/exonuclease/phosphatase family metal-dependent hydrolase
MELTVMTLNLRYNEPKDGDNAWPFRISKAAELIRAWNPVVVGTQEGQRSMLLELEAELGGSYGWLGEGRRGGGESEHTAIFYRKDAVEVVASGQFWLSEAPEEPGSISWDSRWPRICTWAHYRCKGSGGSGKEFVLYNTHLDHKGQLARENGAALIMKRLQSHKEASRIPFILTGDMNAKPGNAAIRRFCGLEPSSGEAAGLFDCSLLLPQPVGCTFHGFKGGSEGEPIDYIFVTNEAKVKEAHVDRRMIGGSYPTDHYPVIATIEL